MSDRPVDIKVGEGSQSTDTVIGLNPSPEEVIAFREHIANVLDRGLVIDRLKVDNLPPEYYSEWAPNDQVSIAAYEAKGFIRDTEFAPKSKLNDSSGGNARVIDVVHMIMPKWKKAIYDEERNKKYHKDHVADRRKLKEERDFKANQDNIGMPTTVGSTITEQTGPQIQEALTPSKT